MLEISNNTSHFYDKNIRGLLSRKKTKSILNNVPFFILILGTIFIFSACKTVPKEVKKELPYLGHSTVENGDTIYHTIPPWKYVTQDSVMLSSSQIKNKVWVVDFIFSTCQNICSPMTYAMKDINDSLKKLGDKVVFLSFSIDPTHDTPSVLKKYKEAHQISAKNWYFLTGGDQEQINQFAINQFLVFATADKDAPGGFAHSQNFILVDQDRHVRGIYDGLTDKGRNGLIEGVKTLINKRK